MDKAEADRRLRARGRGRGRLVEAGGNVVEAVAVALDPRGRLVVSVHQSDRTWIRQTVEAAAMLFDHDHDAEAVRQAVADWQTRHAVKAEAAARSGLAAAIATAQAVAEGDRRRAQTTAAAMGGRS